MQFNVDEITVATYAAPTEEERGLIYPDKTERQLLLEQRKELMSGKCLTGSARFKDSVEKIYKGACKNYDQTALSSGEFTLASAFDDQEDILLVVASEIRGLEDMYCDVISEHRKWAVRRVLPSQRDKSLRKQLPDIAESVSMRSKNFATVGWLRSETSNKPKTNSLDGRTCARKIPEEMFYCTATIRICFT